MKSRQTRRRFASALVVLAVFATLSLEVGCTDAAQPESKLESILSSQTLRVGTTGDFMPFSYRRDDAGNLRGVDIEFARRLATHMGVDIEFVHTSWPELSDDLLADRFDVGLSGITITPERMTVAFFSDPVMSSGKVAIARDEDAHRFRSIGEIDRPGVRVIVNPGGTNEAFAREHFPQATIILNDENLTVFEKIVAGVADVMVTDAAEAAVQEVIRPELEVSNPDTPFNHFEFGMLLPRDQALKDFIDSWLDEQERDRTYQQLFDAELIEIEAALSGDN